MKSIDYPGVPGKIFYVTEWDDRVRSNLAGERALSGDTETTGLKSTDGARLRLLQIADSATASTYVLDIFKLGDRGRAAVRDMLDAWARANRPFVFHNAKFDYKFLRNDLGISGLGRGLRDTMILSQLLACGDQRIKHSLKETLYRYLAIEVAKDLQTSDWSMPELSVHQIGYAAGDATHLVNLADSLSRLITKDALDEVAEIEQLCVEATAQMELNGIELDWQAWTANVARNEERKREIEDIIFEMLAPGEMLFPGIPPFNLNSVQQLKARLKAVGIVLPKMADGDGEKETTQAQYLAQIIDQHDVIKHLIDYRAVEKALSSYGLNWAAYISKLTGRIHADFKQIGTMTGRFACTDPNLQQIPREDVYRNAFVAAIGRLLVWGDYAQMEMRILAELARSRAMTRAFKEGLDLHTAAAAAIFNVKYDAVEKVQRQVAKNLNFGIPYGIGALRFAKNAGLEVIWDSQRGREYSPEGERFIKKYFAEYDGVERFLNESAALARDYRYSRTMAGRLIKYNFNPASPQQVAMAERNGKNTPIQGSNGDITKVAMRLVHDAIDHDNIKLVNVVHDELILEAAVGYEPEAQAILRRCMVEAGERFMKRVPVDVDVKIGERWNK
jgi:DNA polymerase I